MLAATVLHNRQTGLGENLIQLGGGRIGRARLKVLTALSRGSLVTGTGGWIAPVFSHRSITLSDLILNSVICLSSPDQCFG